MTRGSPISGNLHIRRPCQSFLLPLGAAVSLFRGVNWPKLSRACRFIHIQLRRMVGCLLFLLPRMYRCQSLSSIINHWKIMIANDYHYHHYSIRIHSYLPLFHSHVSQAEDALRRQGAPGCRARSSRTCWWRLSMSPDGILGGRWSWRECQWLRLKIGFTEHKWYRCISIVKTCEDYDELLLITGF